MDTTENRVRTQTGGFSQIENHPKSPPKKREVSNTPTKRQRLSSSLESEQRSPPQETPKNIVDADLLFRAIENFNLAKQQVLPLEFDLESIYNDKSFDIEYRESEADTAKKYRVKDVKIPKDNNGHILSTILINVFSEPMNCVYFGDAELDKIFSILMLTESAQSLLARMLKRKRGWHKVGSVKYPEIAADLKPIFRELVEREIFEEDTNNESVPDLLNLLQLDDLRNICKSMKVNNKGTKATLMSELLKLSNRKKSLFPGAKTPSCALIEKIHRVLGGCVRLNEEMDDLLYRVFILLMPNQDPRENMAGVFRTLAEIKYGDRLYPPVPTDRFPIFRDRSHFVSYAKARSELTRIYNASETKDWDTMCATGRLALEYLQPVFRSPNCGEEATPLSTLPSYVRQFEANYTWAKVLWKSVEGFKKTREGIDLAAEFLHSLVNHRGEYLGNPIRWYGELALIEMYHRKNLEVSADVTIAGLKREKLSLKDIAELSERARKLLDRSKNISAETKKRLIEATGLDDRTALSFSKPLENIIEATAVQGNTTGSKSTWSVGIGGTDIGYLRVEEVALLHYTGKGFKGGLHCEGALPVTLFATLFWNEIYGVSVPGAFVSPYQEAPLDLYTSHFLDNRREQMESKLGLMRDLDIEALGKIMCEDFAQYRRYVSLMHGKLFENPEDFRAFIVCLGKNGVIGICERLANNYNQWKSGFPDLALWDPIGKKCKFVEVKGPGDSLSIKQKLWIQFLESLEVGVEVCIVKGTTKKYPT